MNYESYLEDCEEINIIPISKEGDWRSHHKEVIANLPIENKCGQCGNQIDGDVEEELCSDCDL